MDVLSVRRTVNVQSQSSRERGKGEQAHPNVKCGARRGRYSTHEQICMSIHFVWRGRRSRVLLDEDPYSREM